MSTEIDAKFLGGRWGHIMKEGRTLAQKTKFFFPALACLVALSAPSHANVLYTTLGPGGSFDAGSSLSLGGTSVPQIVGMPFSLAGSATVDDAVLALYNATGSAAMDVYIEADTSGIPGSILASFSTVNPLPGVPGLVTFSCLSGCSLSAGSYWLVAQDPIANTQAGWFESDGHTPSPIALSNTGATGPWFAIPPNSGIGLTAFQIDGGTSPTPEPASMLLTGAALGTLMAVRKRRKHA